MTYTKAMFCLRRSILHIQLSEMEINMHAKGKDNKKLLEYKKLCCHWRDKSLEHASCCKVNELVHNLRPIALFLDKDAARDDYKCK